MPDLSHYSERSLAFLARYIMARWRAHALIVGCMIGAVACATLTQWGVKNLVDTLSIQYAPPTAVWVAFALLATLIAADNVLWRVASWSACTTFVRVTGDVRRDLFQHLTGHPVAYFADQQPGGLSSRISATSNALYTLEQMVVFNTLPPCLGTIFAIALVALVSWPLALALWAVATVIVVLMFHWAARGRDLHHAYAASAAAVDGETTDVVGNMPLVQAFGALRRERRRFNMLVHRELKARRQSLLYLERLRLAHGIATAVLAIAVLAYAILLWQRGEATTGEVILVCTLGLSILHATRDLAVSLVDVTQHLSRLSEAVSTLLVPHAMTDRPGAGSLARRGSSVDVERISFRYADGRQVFREFSLSIPAGQRVGLVGPSGSGKSTLLSLVQRFYDVGDGRILLDGQDIAYVTQQSLRDAIALVPQDVALLHRSLRENIGYGRPGTTDAEIEAAIAAASCTDFIAALPQGLDTIVGTRGVKLSGGQKQRIAIARAFLKDAPLLLLDEATSALDPESEALIRQALQRLMHGRTVISIAHRLSTVRDFDRIVVLDEGRIAEDGSPAELMRRDGIYRRLLAREVSRLVDEAA